MTENDKINHPSHYVNASVMIEPIELCELLPFCLGNACKYLIRAGSKKGESESDDLKKAMWYLNRNASECVQDFTFDDIPHFGYIVTKFAESNPYISALFQVPIIQIYEKGAVLLIEKRLSEIEQNEGLTALNEGE